MPHSTYVGKIASPAVETSWHLPLSVSFPHNCISTQSHRGLTPTRGSQKVIVYWSLSRLRVLTWGEARQLVCVPTQTERVGPHFTRAQTLCVSGTYNHVDTHKGARLWLWLTCHVPASCAAFMVCFKPWRSFCLGNMSLVSSISPA